MSVHRSIVDVRTDAYSHRSPTRPSINGIKGNRSFENLLV